MIALTVNPKCWDGWTIIQKWSDGRNNYLVKNEGRFGVMKIFDLKHQSTRERYLKDLHHHQVLSDADVAPTLLFTNTCDNAGIMITEKYEASLQDLIDKNQMTDDLKEDLTSLITQKVKTMHTMNIAHGDLHTGNIVVNLDPLKVALIDYEYAFSIDTGKTDPEVQDWMQRGFDWQGTYEDFVRYDFENWRNMMDD